jgi:hypothetical protein
MIFTMPYRGGTKTWSQLWHFNGGAWQDQTHFDTLSDNLWNEVKSVTLASVTLVETIAYNPGSSLPVYTKSYGAAGTYTDTSNPQAMGEVCMLWRFTTDQRSTKNHPIYLFKWFHHTQSDGSSSPDVLRSGIHSTCSSVISAIVAGLSDGTLTRVYCGPRGAVAQSGTCESNLYVREFPT